MASVFGAAALIAGHPTVVGWLGLAFIPYAIALRQVPNWQKLGTVRIDNRRVAVRRWDLPRVSVDSSNPKDIAIVVEPGAERITLRSGRAIAFLSEILPRVNWDGGSEHELRSAVREVDAAESAVGSTSKANEQQVWERIVEGRRRELWPLSRLLTVRRLALEMAVTEEIERRTLNLDAWILSYAAERESEVAHIADNMFIPEAVHRLFGQMQRDHRDVQPNEEL